MVDQSTEDAQNLIKVDYKIEGVIGKGAFATVRKGKHRESGDRVAIKIIKKNKMEEEDEAALENEIRILREVDHDNICKLVNVYEDKNHHCLIMDLVKGGELFDMIAELDHFDEKHLHQ